MLNDRKSRRLFGIFKVATSNNLPAISYNSGNIILASAAGAKIYKMPMVSFMICCIYYPTHHTSMKYRPYNMFHNVW